jgi:hypothetical protein
MQTREILDHPQDHVDRSHGPSDVLHIRDYYVFVPNNYDFTPKI